MKLSDSAQGMDPHDGDEERRFSKRARKTVERIDSQYASEGGKVQREIGAAGAGTPLGEIQITNHHISSLPSKHGLLMALHKLLYLRVGSKTERKKNIRLFSGFIRDEDATKAEETLAAAPMWSTPCLKDLCRLFDLERSGNKKELVDRIIAFLQHPADRR